MKDTLLFLAGTWCGVMIFSLICLAREIYDFYYGEKCDICGAPDPAGHDEYFGPVCTQCEADLSEIGATLLKLSNKL